jgi:hypothetical protein
VRNALILASVVVVAVVAGAVWYFATKPGSSGSPSTEAPELPSNLPDHYGVYIERDGQWVELNTSADFKGVPIVAAYAPRLLIFHKNVEKMMARIRLRNMYWVAEHRTYKWNTWESEAAGVEPIGEWRVVGGNNPRAPTYTLATVIKPVSEQSEMVLIESKYPLGMGTYAFTHADLWDGHDEVFSTFVLHEREEDLRRYACVFLHTGPLVSKWKEWLQWPSGSKTALPCDGYRAAAILGNIADELVGKDDAPRALEARREAIQHLMSFQPAESPQLRADWLHLLCWNRTMLGEDSAAALKECEEANELVPGGYKELRGFALLRAGRAEEAIADFTEILDAYKDAPYSYAGRGFAKIAKGDVEGGEADLAEAERLSPGTVKRFEAYGFAKGPSSKSEPAETPCLAKDCYPAQESIATQESPAELQSDLLSTEGIGQAIAGVAAEPAETTPPPADASPRSEGSETLSGSWSGKVKQSDGQSYSVTIVISGSGKAAIRYPELGCSGELDPLGREGAAAKFLEHLREVQTCTDGGTVFLTRSGSRMSFRWVKVGRPTALADLVRTGE